MANKSVPKELQDPFEIYSMFEENNKLEELSNETVQPILVWFNDEKFKNEDEQIEDGIKTYLLCKMSDDTFKMFNGFSLTFRIKIQLLMGIFGANLPKITVSKVSKGMKQEYSIKPHKN
jgi:hypothetical protein